MSARKSDKNRSKKDQLPKRLFKRPRGPEIPPGFNVVYEPPGHAKMSEVLEDFIEPYDQLCKTESSHRKILTLAVLAWNVALAPEASRRGMLDRALRAGLGNASEEDLDVAREMVEEMVRRKLMYFAENHRKIVSFDLRTTDTGLHLFVASTL